MWWKSSSPGRTHRSKNGPSHPWVLGVAATTVFASSVGSALPSTVHLAQRVPEMRITLGSSLEQIVAATERCTLESRAPCSVDDYSTELGSGITIKVESFSMDRFEVSQADYQRCVEAGICKKARLDLLPALMRNPNFPIVMVNLVDATNYCTYVGGSLPSEAQFEAAAAGRPGRRYPWGNLFHGDLANYGMRNAPYTDATDGFELLAEVAQFKRGSSLQGIVQLAGNVAEWTVSPLAPHGERDPKGAASARMVVVKGGSFRSLPVDLRAQARRGMDPTHTAVDVGFRCIRGK